MAKTHEHQMSHTYLKETYNTQNVKGLRAIDPLTLNLDFPARSPLDRKALLNYCRMQTAMIPIQSKSIRRF